VRIVGGSFAGRALTSPNDFRVRPTAEEVRAAVAAQLMADLPEASVLDLFAGTGALGLEAISRGARRCDFVETRPSSLHALKANVITLGLKGRTRIFKKDALPFAAQLSRDAYDVAFVDPPYGSRMLDHVITAWVRTEFAAVLVAEHATAHVLPAGATTLRFGETSVTIYRRAPRAV